MQQVVIIVYNDLTIVILIRMMDFNHQNKSSLLMQNRNKIALLPKYFRILKRIETSEIMPVTCGIRV